MTYRILIVRSISGWQIKNTNVVNSRFLIFFMKNKLKIIYEVDNEINVIHEINSDLYYLNSIAFVKSFILINLKLILEPSRGNNYICKPD